MKKEIIPKIYRIVPIFCLFGIFQLNNYKEEIGSTLHWVLLAILGIIIIYCFVQTKPTKKRLLVLGVFVIITLVVLGISLYL